MVLDNEHLEKHHLGVLKNVLGNWEGHPLLASIPKGNQKQGI